MAIVCLCTFPIAVESGKPQNIAALPTGAENKFEEFTLVTAEEKELLQMLRANLKESNVAIRKAEKEAPAAKRKLTARMVERQITDVPEKAPAQRADRNQAGRTADADTDWRKKPQRGHPGYKDNKLGLKLIQFFVSRSGILC